MADKFMDYFTEEIEYPKMVGYEIMPWGHYWEYISSTFLNGFINYVDIKFAFLVDRYTIDDGYNDHEDVELKKQALIDFLRKKDVHTHLSEFQDDIIVLGEVEKNSYMFFWFDCDVSDCCIARFKTSDQLFKIKENLRAFVKEIYYEHTLDKQDEYDPTELPSECFTGWISF